MNKQSGFTLIEIVMVLVLLGILSAVAVPKYFDLQKQAELRAGQAAVAEAQARVNALFAEALLKGATCTNAVTYIQSKSAPTGDAAKFISDWVNGNAMNDWTVSWEVVSAGTKVSADKLTVTRTGGTAMNFADFQDTHKPSITIPACNN